MPLSFFIPSKFEEAELSPDEEPGIYVHTKDDLSALSSKEKKAYIEELTYELSEREILCIEDQSIFDKVYSSVCFFSELNSTERDLLIDCLCSNFSCLRPSITSLTSSPKNTDSNAADFEGYNFLLLSHRNAFKLYSFFLHRILVMSEDTFSSQLRNAPKSTVKGKSARKKLGVEFEWQWEDQRLNILRTLSSALEIDLKKLFQRANLEESLILLYQKSAISMLESNTARDKEVRELVAAILSNCAVKFESMISVVTCLTNLLFKEEKYSSILAGIVAFSENKFRNGSLAPNLIHDIGRCDTAYFETNVNSARQFSDFLTALADQIPGQMENYLPLFVHHLEGKSHFLRSAIVSVIGKVLSKGSTVPDKTTEGKAAHLKSKQGLLNVLIERTRDESAFTRNRVLQVFSSLCEGHALPLNHWNEIVEIAAQRVEDKAVLVRKSALQLLITLLQCNPFGPSLNTGSFEKTLEKYQNSLQILISNESNAHIDSTISLDPSSTLPASPPKDGTHESDSHESGQTCVDSASSSMKESKDVDNLLNEDTAVSGTANDSYQTQYEDDDANEEGKSSSQVPKTFIQPTILDHEMDNFSIKQTKTLLDSLTHALNFAKILKKFLTVAIRFLASSSNSDVENTIQFLVCAQQFNIDGSKECMKKIMPLIYSQEQNIRECVETAIFTLYMRGSNFQTVKNLISLTFDLTLGEFSSLETIIINFVRKGDIGSQIISLLWNFFTFNIPNANDAYSKGALIILTMTLASNQTISSHHITSLINIGLGEKSKCDFVFAKFTCIALQRLTEKDKKSFSSNRKLLLSLSNLILNFPSSSNHCFSMIEQVINTVYSLHPHPHVFFSLVLEKMTVNIFSRKLEAKKSIHSLKQSENVRNPIDDDGDMDDNNNKNRNNMEGTDGSRAIEDTNGITVDDNASEIDKNNGKKDENGGNEKGTAVKNTSKNVNLNEVKRFVFVVGHVAIQHLLFIESLVKKAKKKNVEKEKSNSSVEITKQNQKSSIDAELGMIYSFDSKIEILQERAEENIIGGEEKRTFFLSLSAQIIVKLCRNKALMQKHPSLQECAMLSLCKLMVIDSNFCEDQMRLFFTILEQDKNAHVRSNCIIALGDLAIRFPNLVESWTSHMYKSLTDTCHSVRKTALLILSHLILNDMIKVKGHISEIALCIEDEISIISDLAKRFFLHLSKKGSNHLYNLLPDILSKLSNNHSLSSTTFQNIMTFFIAFIDKEKQMEGLIEKLCIRFSNTDEAKQWRDLSYCLSLLSFSEKGIRKLSDSFKHLKLSLIDDQVFEYFKSIINKAKKFVKSDARTVFDELESKLVEARQELCPPKAAMSPQKAVDNQNPGAVSANVRSKPGKSSCIENSAPKVESQNPGAVLANVQAKPEKSSCSESSAPEVENKNPKSRVSANAQSKPENNNCGESSVSEVENSDSEDDEVFTPFVRTKKVKTENKRNKRVLKTCESSDED